MTTDEIAEKICKDISYLITSSYGCFYFHKELQIKAMPDIIKTLQSIHPDSKLVAEIQRMKDEAEKDLQGCDAMDRIYGAQTAFDILKHLLQFSQEGINKMEWHKQTMLCLECKHVWQGMVVDGMKDGLECPECHKMTGHVLTGEESSKKESGK